MRTKKTWSSRSALKIFFNPDDSLKFVDYRGIDVLKSPSFVRLTGSEKAKFKQAIFELGVRNIIRIEDLKELLLQFEERKFGR